MNEYTQKKYTSEWRKELALIKAICFKAYILHDQLELIFTHIWKLPEGRSDTNFSTLSP